MGSPDEWYAIWRKKDDAAIRGGAIRTAFERMKQMKAYGDAGYSGRVWAPSADAPLGLTWVVLGK